MGNCGESISNLFSPQNKDLKQEEKKHLGDKYCVSCNMHYGHEVSKQDIKHKKRCLKNKADTVDPQSSKDNERIEQDIIYKVPKDDFNDFLWAKVPSNKEKTEFQWEKRKINLQSDIYGLLKKCSSQVKTLSFQEKQIWFRKKLDVFRIPWEKGADWLTIHKDNVLLTSLASIEKINLHQQVKIAINEDQVSDAGGLLRQWMYMIIKEIFHPNTGMFILCDIDESSYRINPEAEFDEHIINCFKLFGKIIGKAVFERIPLNAFLDQTLIQNILGQPVELNDFLFFDKQLHSTWSYLLQNEFNEQDFFGFFVVTKPGSSTNEEVELKPNGKTIMLDNQNKEEFVKLSIEYFTNICIQPFLNAITSEVYQVVPQDLLSIFEPYEFEMILNGLPFININDWEFHTVYKGSYHKTHTIIQWFWTYLKTLQQEQLQQFLHFVSGSTRTPVEGFRFLQSNRGNFTQFNIESVPFNKRQPYPKAHTCFNRLELPMYPTESELIEYVSFIIKADLEGVFGLD